VAVEGPGKRSPDRLVLHLEGRRVRRACRPRSAGWDRQGSDNLGAEWGRGTSDVKWTKKIVFILVVGFCLFYLIQQPEGAAEAVRTVFGALVRAFQALVTFFTSLAA
jgi:hypothetical protein